jgi:hypothetical protein
MERVPILMNQILLPVMMGIIVRLGIVVLLVLVFQVHLLIVQEMRLNVKRVLVLVMQRLEHVSIYRRLMVRNVMMGIIVLLGIIVQVEFVSQGRIFAVKRDTLLKNLYVVFV